MATVRVAVWLLENYYYSAFQYQHTRETADKRRECPNQHSEKSNPYWISHSKFQAPFAGYLDDRPANRFTRLVIEQRFGVFQIGGVEAFGEPVVDSASIARASSRRSGVAQQAGEAKWSRAAPRTSRPSSAERDRLAKSASASSRSPSLSRSSPRDPEHLGPLHSSWGSTGAPTRWWP